MGKDQKGVKTLLPIKTKQGVLQRSAKADPGELVTLFLHVSLSGISCIYDNHNSVCFLSPSDIEM
jgi:hypothetical protein